MIPKTLYYFSMERNLVQVSCIWGFPPPRNKGVFRTTGDDRSRNFCCWLWMPATNTLNSQTRFKIGDASLLIILPIEDVCRFCRKKACPCGLLVGDHHFQNSDNSLIINMHVRRKSMHVESHYELFEYFF